MNSLNAPVALFCFNRPQHLERMLTSLMACRGFESTSLFVYADGPRHEADRPLVAAVREALARRLPASATVIARPANVGLAANIIDGVSTLCQTHGRVIVIEDDLLLDPRFLHFMNEALERYADMAHVYQISGYMFDVPALAGQREAVFLPHSSTWGWATWQRAWQHFDPLATGWQTLTRDATMRRRFNLDNAYDYASMLESHMRGHINSWGVRWYWTVFKAGALVVFPPFSLVDNTGFDGSGTHGRGWLRRFGHAGAAAVPSGPISLPGSAVLDERIRRQVRDTVWRHNGSWLGQMVSRGRRAVQRLRRSRSKGQQ